MLDRNRSRTVFGFATALVFLSAFAFHGLGWHKLDEVGVSLLLLSIGGLVLALAHHIGITKIGVGEFAFELPGVEDAMMAFSAREAQDVRRVLERDQRLLPATGLRVLWIDDRPDQLIPHRRLLRRLGMEVVAVSSTEAAQEELKRDGDFAIVIQDRLRREPGEARALVDWMQGDHGHRHNVSMVPVVVFSFDPFDPDIGVAPDDWITRKPANLLERLIAEVRRRATQGSGAGDKPP